jgi:hypothetical protein
MAAEGGSNSYTIMLPSFISYGYFCMYFLELSQLSVFSFHSSAFISPEFS